MGNITRVFWVPDEAWVSLEEALETSMGCNQRSRLNALYSLFYCSPRCYHHALSCIHVNTEIAYAESEPSPKNKVEVKRCPITSKMVIDREDIDGDPKGFAVHINDGSNIFKVGHSCSTD